MLTKHFIKLSLSIVFLLLLLIPLEFGIRYMYPKFDPSGMVKFEYNDEYKFRIGRKNYSGRQIKSTGDYDTNIRFNRYGFRDNKDIAKIKPAEFVVVGDSFSLGWGVDEQKRYSNKLEELLRTPVYNIGISNNLRGYKGLISYAESQGARINNVILGLCMENDLLDYTKPDQEKSIPHSRFIRLKHFLSNFALFNLFTKYVHSSPWLRSYALRYRLIFDNIEGIPKNEIDGLVLKSSISIIEELNKIYNLVVVVIPSRGLWAGSNRTAENIVHEKFIELLKENNIRYVDLRKPFEASDSPLEYHFKNDGHWNEMGHNLAAKKIYDFLNLKCRDSNRTDCP